jgi:hypothetical protein
VNPRAKLGGRPALRTRPWPARAALLATAAAAALVGCGPASGPDDPLWSDEAQPTGEASTPIVNGTTDNGDPAVVALTVWGSQFCTGTLIAPTVVITAAHCLPPNLAAEGITAYTQIEVFFGTDVNGVGDTRSVVAGWTNPAWNDQAMEDDFGMVRLSSAAPTAPIPLNTNAPVLGESVRIIGFGITSEAAQSSNGLKREGTTVIDGVFQGVFTMSQSPANVCSGDSGGTALVVRGGGEVLAGVHSRSDCLTQGIDTRVDWYLDDINAFIGNIPAANCSADGQCATGCPAPDPDCPCADDTFCTAACPDLTTDPNCDLNCVANGVCAVGPCPAPDPDCACGADGFCNAACPGTDPDCGPSCPQDGVCNAACPNDPDCWVPGGTPAQDYHGDLQGSCSVAAPMPGRTPNGALVALLGLALARTRRRGRAAA